MHIIYSILIGNPMRLKFYVAVSVVCLILLGSSVDGKNRPTVDDPNGDSCFNDPTTDKI